MTHPWMTFGLCCGALAVALALVAAVLLISAI